MEKKNPSMDLDSAAEYIAKHLFQIDADTENMENAETARQLAFQALKRASETIISIRMSDTFHVDYAENIGTIMNNDDVSSDINGQRYYSIHALFHAAASLAKAMTDDGCELVNVVEIVLEAFQHSFQEIGILVDVSEPAKEEVGSRIRPMHTDNKNLPS